MLISEGRLACDLVYPGDDGWDIARQAWNLAADQRPALVAFPQSAEDVVAVVDYARSRGLRIAPQGTGHNASAIASLEGTVLLSTARMKGVEIDPVARRARVQAGALWLEVTTPASEHGLAPLAGSSPDVGVVGYTLGGGLSWLGRRHGLAANSVLAIELVTADGRLRRVDADNDPDLFWALRGGGGSFGVVTAMEFALYPAQELYAGALFWPWERSAEVLHAWREWTATAPDEVTTSARIMQMPPIPDVPEPLRGRSFVTIDGAFLGSEAAGEALLRPLRDLEPEIDMFGAVPPVALSRIHGDPEQPVPYHSRHHMLRELPAEAVDALVSAAGPGSDSRLLMVEIRHLGGAVGRTVPGHGAIGRFEEPYLLDVIGLVGGPGAELDPQIPAVADALAPWHTERVYLNFEERPSDPGRIFDAETHRRLRAVKAAVDPADTMLSNHPISPAE